MSTFLFKSDFLALSFSDWIFFILFTVLFVAAIVFYLLKRKNRRSNIILSRLFGRMAFGFMATAVTGGVWAGIRILAVPYIGTRIVPILIILGFFIWFFFVLKYLTNNFAAENKNWKQQSLKEKYLK